MSQIKIYCDKICHYNDYKSHEHRPTPRTSCTSNIPKTMSSVQHSIIKNYTNSEFLETWHFSLSLFLCQALFRIYKKYMPGVEHSC